MLDSHVFEKRNYSVSDIWTFGGTVATAVISSGVVMTVVTHVLSRRQRQKEEQRKADDDKRQEELDRIRRERAEDDRRELLAEAQNTAQRTALESANERYGRLNEDYQDCRTCLIQIRDATALLIDVFENFLIRLKPHSEDAEVYMTTIQLNELGEARRVINEARRQLR